MLKFPYQVNLLEDKGHVLPTHHPATTQSTKAVTSSLSHMSVSPAPLWNDDLMGILLPYLP